MACYVVDRKLYKQLIIDLLFIDIISIVKPEHILEITTRGL